MFIITVHGECTEIIQTDAWMFFQKMACRAAGELGFALRRGLSMVSPPCPVVRPVRFSVWSSSKAGHMEEGPCVAGSARWGGTSSDECHWVEFWVEAAALTCLSGALSPAARKLNSS